MTKQWDKVELKRVALFELMATLPGFEGCENVADKEIRAKWLRKFARKESKLSDMSKAKAKRWKKAARKVKDLLGEIRRDREELLGVCFGGGLDY